MSDLLNNIQVGSLIEEWFVKSFPPKLISVGLVIRKTKDEIIIQWSDTSGIIPYKHHDFLALLSDQLSIFHKFKIK